MEVPFWDDLCGRALLHCHSKLRHTSMVQRWWTCFRFFSSTVVALEKVIVRIKNY
ncbi:hypothetical protein CDL12_01315 [Handroanthus impetiginosus]|uniref:Uncharacterized protein n=1 Tax=Handroanthus impetiginosus TaxID=429701 RepID=A0A2G9I870_9LAMI|nr:hypothetical protein CDL12_01315 [Handroanthus impetiginosus]